MTDIYFEGTLSVRKDASERFSPPTYYGVLRAPRKKQQSLVTVYTSLVRIFHLHFLLLYRKLPISMVSTYLKTVLHDN